MKSRRLLIVEDEIILAMNLRTRLTDMGYSVVSIASTGTAAITAAEQHQPDLILMDIRLYGGMDGIAAALEIRRHHDIPVIFMSAYGNEETQQRAAATEPAGFLSKLTDDLDLRAAIETALAGHQVK
ncbi:MAG: response regulator [Verrucomicrobia bacterium]|nr:response regulator [Verrucomicrobiota bacterium]